MENLNLLINDMRFDWHEPYISGANVKRLGEIPDADLVFLAIKKPWEDELIENETLVDLTRPGIEHFYSKKHDEHLPYKIMVNGREKQWGSRIISYEQVAELAFPDYSENNTTVYTVSYTEGPGQNPEGTTMVKSDKVYVKNKMIFNVTATNKS
jgi:hypothetical protein